MEFMKLQSIQHNNVVDWLKWFAIATMFIDHLRFIPNQNYEILHIIGRAAFPIFAILCGWNITLLSKNPQAFAKRVTLFGLALMAVEPFTIAGPLPLNPVITLGLGLMLSIPVLKIKSQRLKASAALFLTSLAVLLTYFLPIGILVSYGWAGIAIIPVMSLLSEVVKKGCSFGSTPLLFCVLLLSYYLNEEVLYQWMSLFWSAMAIYLLAKAKMPPCPFPNNYWLYLSFPLSTVLPTLLKHIIIVTR